MKNLSIKSIIYFNPGIHQTLRQRATNNRTSLSAQVNEAVGNMLRANLKRHRKL